MEHDILSAILGGAGSTVGYYISPFLYNYMCEKRKALLNIKTGNGLEH